MIDLNDLTSELTDKLNDAVDASDLNEIIPNVRFAFRIVLDTADYKAPTFDKNVTTYYIHGLMTVNSSTAEGVTDKAYNAAMSTSVDFLIPLCDEQDTNGEERVLKAVRSILTNALQSSSGDTYTVGGIQYYVGTTYDIARTGRRDIRARVGDSITLLANVNYFFVALGVSSSNIVLKIGNERVYFSTIALSRKTASESNTRADGDGEIKNTPTGSAMIVSFTAPLRTNEYDRLFQNFFIGELDQYIIIEVQLELPGTPDAVLKMLIDEVDIGGEQNLAASLSVTLREYLDPNTRS